MSQQHRRSLAARIVVAVPVVLVLIGLGILAIDRWWVKPRLSATEIAAQHADIATGLGLQWQPLGNDESRLLDVLAELPWLGATRGGVDSVMTRSDVNHQLWLFEVQETEFVRRLVIMVQLKGAQLPRWAQGNGQPPPQPPWTREAAERADRIEDLAVGMTGEFIVWRAQGSGQLIRDVSEQSSSPRFQPGLRNESLAIDVQRALDVINLLDTGQPALPRVYTIDVEVDIATPSIDAFRERQQQRRAQIQQDMEAKLQVFRERNEEAQRAFREENQRLREEFLERTRNPDRREGEQASESESSPATPADPPSSGN